MQRVLLVIILTLSQLLASCSYSRTQVWYEFSIDGPARLMQDVEYQVATGDNGFLFHTRDNNPVTLRLRQVQEFQLVTVTVDVRRRDAGFYSSSFNSNDGEIIARALWVLSEPYRANFELFVGSDLQPADLRLEVDRNNDGDYEVELAPQIALTGKHLEMAPIYWNENPATVVERITPTQSRITLDYPQDIQSYDATPLEIVYAIYPDQPELQVYEEPFTVHLGNTVRYRVLFQNGLIGISPEIPIR